MPSRASGEAPASRCKSRSRSSCWASVLVEEAASARLASAQRIGRRGRKLARHRRHLRFQLVVVDHLPDQPPGLGLLGAQRLGQHGKPAGAGGADEARQHPGAARVGDQPDAGEGLQEARAARGIHEVAGQRDVGRGAGGDAVDGADHRLLQRGDQLDQRIVGLLQPAAGVGRGRRPWARPPRPGPGRPRRRGPRRSARPPGTADRHWPPPARRAARRAWPSVKALSLSGRLSVSRVTPPLCAIRTVLPLTCEVLPFRPLIEPTLGPIWARRLGMPGPVVYSAAATEPRAILNDDNAVPASGAGSPGHSVDGRRRGREDDRDATIWGASDA